jgi:hypothetical protein
MNESRNAFICEQFKSGVTLTELARVYGVSRQRIHQIIAKAGLSRRHGGEYVKRTPKRESRIAEHLKKWGMSRAEKAKYVIYWKGICVNVTKVYFAQKHNAEYRNIGFRLSFKEWLDVWGELLLHRGRGKRGLCMCRFNDSGSYEYGNVFIGYAVENSRAGKTRKYSAQRPLKSLNSVDFSGI